MVGGYATHPWEAAARDGPGPSGAAVWNVMPAGHATCHAIRIHEATRCNRGRTDTLESCPGVRSPARRSSFQRVSSTALRPNFDGSLTTRRARTSTLRSVHCGMHRGRKRSKGLAMRKTDKTLGGMRSPSTVPMRIASSFALISMLFAVAPAQSQPSAGSEPAAPASVRTDVAAKESPAASVAPGPFTYESLGATPRVRKPARPRAATTATKSLDATGKATKPAPAATNEPTRTGSR